MRVYVCDCLVPYRRRFLGLSGLDCAAGRRLALPAFFCLPALPRSKKARRNTHTHTKTERHRCGGLCQKGDELTAGLTTLNTRTFRKMPSQLTPANGVRVVGGLLAREPPRPA